MITEERKAEMRTLAVATTAVVKQFNDRMMELLPKLQAVTAEEREFNDKDPEMKKTVNLLEAECDLALNFLQP
jgi:hypothetical protein